MQLEGHNQLAGLDGRAFLDENLIDRAADAGDDVDFHLHGLDDRDNLVFLDRVTRLDVELGDHAGDGRADLALVVGVGQRDRTHLGYGVLIGYSNLAAHTVKEDVAAHAHDVAIGLAIAAVILDNLGVETPGGDRAVGGIGRELFDFTACCVEVNRRQQLARTAGDGLFALEHDLLQIFGEAPRGLTHHALEVGDNRVGVGQRAAALEDIFRGQTVLHYEDRQVTDHLGGRRNFDNIVQHVVDRNIYVFDILELVNQAKALNLRAQVGVLTARHLVAVDVGQGIADIGFKLGVALAHIRPVIGQVLQLMRVKAGVTRLTLQGGDDGVHGRLAGGRGHGVDRAVHDVHTGLGSHQVGRNLVARGVVRVQVDGEADLVTSFLAA